MPRRRRSPARFLAPIALIAVIVAAYIVVQQYRDGTKADGSATATSTLQRSDGSTTATTTEAADTKKKKKKKKVYVVKPGDILSTVAEKTGLTVDELQEYNPDIDPQALQVGQKLKLTASGSSSSDKTDTTTTP
jgi:LysM repeat protein